jgi:hypothetical protein
MAKPVTINIEYTRGDTEPFGFTIKDAAGAVVDVSGSTFTLTVNTESDGDSASSVELFTLTATFVTDGTDGKIRFTPTTIESNQVAAVYFYDVQQDTPTIRTIVSGTFTILTQVNTP